ncbi:MAG: hypothetical protein ABIR81_05220, partial [Ginsengibacter sp.]
MKRFAKVFEQSYIRFLDLQKAEAQAREATIEAALERVRSRSMDMHESNEVMDVAVCLYNELQKLDFKFGETSAATIIIMDQKTGNMEHWLAGFLQKNHVESYEVNNSDHPLNAAQLKAWREGKSFVSIEISGPALKDYAEEMFTQSGYRNLPDEEKTMLAAQEHVVFNLAFMSHGALMWAPSALSDENAIVLQRFAKVFEQTYTRFLDLQKAEAQAREATIEAALERVRSRAMAMQNSNDLNSLISFLFSECTRLDLVLDRCLVMIVDPETLSTTWVLSNPEIPAEPSNHFVQYHTHPPYLAYLDAWKKRIERWHFLLEGDEKKEWDKFLFQQTELSNLPDQVKSGMQSISSIRLNCSFNNFGSITLSSFEPLTDSQSDILIRFTKVFDSTYTRFNDLKKAEAQAREATIEAALERVRSTSLAMHHTNELEKVVSLLFDKLVELGLSFSGAGIYLISEE